MKDYIKPLEDFIENSGRGLIYIDEQGSIISYSTLARKITGILSAGDMKHDAGSIEEGDIVIIADNELGTDDDMSPEDLAYIGIENKRIRTGTAILGVGSYRKNGGSYPKSQYKYANNYSTNGSLSINVSYLGHRVSASIDFANRTINIDVDGVAIEMNYFESVGHMVVLDGETGKMKFFQARGYGYRKEEIGKLLRGRPFVEKVAEGTSTQEGEQLVGKKYNDGVFDENFLQIIKGLFDDVKDVIKSGVYEIHQRPFYINFIRVRQRCDFDGVYILIMDYADFNNLVAQQGNLIKQMERIQRGKNVVPFKEDALEHISGLVGRTASILEVKQLANRASKGKFNVLITGESGTGKTRLAREIHNLSGTARPFVEVNCSAIPQNLFESELFGYVGGAFTGASEKGKKGYFEEANGGTIFLDEIGEIPTTLQAKLLQVLQTKQIYRVGSTKPIDVDVRVIASTNTNIKEAVEKGTFREDLYYRLDVFPIHVPPLRERKGDIRELTEVFLERTCEEYGVERKRLSEDAYEKIFSYNWPGNVRELENAIMRAVAICESSVIYEDFIYLDPLNHREDREGGNLKSRMEALEKELIRDAIQRNGGNKSAAMRELGITKTILYEKLKRYGM